MTDIDLVAELFRLNCSYFWEEKRSIIVHQSNTLCNTEETEELI